jgi:hypothetical protein
MPSQTAESLISYTTKNIPDVQDSRLFIEVILKMGGSLKRSLGMASFAFTIPIPINGNRDEAATRRRSDFDGLLAVTQVFPISRRGLFLLDSISSRWHYCRPGFENPAPKNH